jgi:hypothetical protein
VYIIPALAYIRLIQPSGFSALFGPCILIAYGTGVALALAYANCCCLLLLREIVSCLILLIAVYGIVGTYYAAYNIAKGQAHH